MKTDAIHKILECRFHSNGMSEHSFYALRLMMIDGSQVIVTVDPEELNATRAIDTSDLTFTMRGDWFLDALCSFLNIHQNDIRHAMKNLVQMTINGEVTALDGSQTL